jgi:hypothetical protein
MIGPLGYLLALCAVVLGVVLYRTQNAAARREVAYRHRIIALQTEIRTLRGKITDPRTIRTDRDRFTRR